MSATGVSSLYAGTRQVGDGRWVYDPAPIVQAVGHFGRELDQLDVGCGAGYLASLYATTTANRVTGVDVCDLSDARRVLYDAVVADVDSDGLPFSDESFDVVTCTEMIEHVFRPARVIEEIARVLRPGGRGLVSTPNLHGLSERVAMLFGRPSAWLEHRGDNLEHIRFFSVRSLQGLLECRGLRVTSTEGIGIVGFDPLLAKLVTMVASAAVFPRTPFTTAGRLRSEPFLRARDSWERKIGRRLPTLAPAIAVTFEKPGAGT